jgi:hypothetical protein
MTATLSNLQVSHWSLQPECERVGSSSARFRDSQMAFSTKAVRRGAATFKEVETPAKGLGIHFNEVPAPPATWPRAIGVCRAEAAR